MSVLLVGSLSEQTGETDGFVDVFDARLDESVRAFDSFGTNVLQATLSIGRLRGGGTTP